MDILTKIVRMFFKEKIEEDPIPQPSGRITIEYDSESGDFNVLSEIYDYSDDSLDILSLLLFHMKHGGLESFIYESLGLWAGQDEEKVNFIVNVGLKHHEMENTMASESQEEGQQDRKTNVAVSASKVFNFRDMK